VQAVRISPKSVGQGLCLAALVSGRRELEAIQLFRIDGIDMEAMLKQRFYDGISRGFDGHMDVLWFAVCHLCEPVGHLSQAFAAMVEGLVSEWFPVFREYVGLICAPNRYTCTDCRA